MCRSQKIPLRIVTTYQSSHNVRLAGLICFASWQNPAFPGSGETTAILRRVDTMGIVRLVHCVVLREKCGRRQLEDAGEAGGVKMGRGRFYLLYAALCVMPLLIITGHAAAETTETERAAQSRMLVKDFAKTLKGELVKAMKSGGPAAAVSVCHAAAPEIAAEKSAATGWRVARTALKLRNPKNAPDDWERTVLEAFLAKAKQGADLSKLEHYETVSQGGKRMFRYMKAIPVGKPCLICHGSAVKAELVQSIKEHYPDDNATGFKLGELRGAFTITQPFGRD